MTANSGSVDYWRKYFQSTNCNIFEVIEQAMLVAAADFPEEFRSRRDQIVEKLFASELALCFGSDSEEELQLPIDADNLGEAEGDGNLKREAGEKGSNVDICNGENEEQIKEGEWIAAEGITDTMKDKNPITEEVLKLKEILNGDHEKSGAVLYETLKQLQLMELSYEILKETKIGRSVKSLRKHNCKKIRHLVRALIKDWQDVVDKWIDSMNAIPDQSPDFVNPTMADEEGGLLCPPMATEEELLAMQNISFDLSTFFDDMDDDGNFIASEITKTPVSESHVHMRMEEPSQKVLVAQQPSPQNPTYAQPKAQGIVNIPQDEPNNSEEATFRAKLELTKRKLHEGYQRAEDAKKQRTLKIVKFEDVPKEQQDRALDKKPELKKSKEKPKNRANAGHCS